MSSAESRQHHLSTYATMQFKHHNYSTPSLQSDRILSLNSLQYSHNSAHLRPSSPLMDQRYEPQGLGYTDHQPSVFTMNMHGHHAPDPHPELSTPSSSSMGQFQQQSHGDQRWLHYLDNARFDYMSPSMQPNFHSPYPSSYPPHRLEPPLHDFRQTHQSQQTNGGVNTPGAQRLSLAGSLDPTTGVFYRTPEHPRLRTAQACEKCRTRKAKCSGEHPSCKRCLTRGLICQYAKEGRVRGPNKPKVKPPTSASSTPEASGKASSTVADSPSPSTDVPTDAPAPTKSRRGSLSLGESRASRPRPPDLQNHFRMEPHQEYTEAGMQNLHDYSQSTLSGSTLVSSSGHSLSQSPAQLQTSHSAPQLQSLSSQHHGNGEQDSPSIPRSAASSTFSQRDPSPASTSTAISDGLSVASLPLASSIGSGDSMMPLASGIPSVPEYHLNMPESHHEFGVEMGTRLPHAQVSTSAAPFSLVHTQNSSPHGAIQHTQFPYHSSAYHRVTPHLSRSQSNNLHFSADAGMR